MSELNEKQFQFLKALANTDTALIFMPHSLPTDDPSEMIRSYENKKLLTGLRKLGYVEEVTEQFEHVLEPIRKQKQREFSAFILTELAVKMFKPEEGEIH